MLYIKSSESINMCNVIRDGAGWHYASVSSVSKIRGALWVHVQGYLYSKRLLPCRSVAMEEPHIVFEADRCSLATGRSPFSLFLQPAGVPASPVTKNKAATHLFGAGIGRGGRDQELPKHTQTCCVSTASVFQTFCTSFRVDNLSLKKGNQKTMSCCICLVTLMLWPFKKLLTKVSLVP